MMEMERRMLYTKVFHIDTNLINARGKLEAMNKIEKWAEDQVILVNMSSTSMGEAQKGNNKTRTSKALSHIFTIINDDVLTSKPLYQKVAHILFPVGIKNENQANDVKIICHASHYHAILITNDGGSKRQPGGILGNAQQLRAFVDIMNPQEAVNYIEAKIKERDDTNKQISEYTGKPLPKWTDKD